MVEKTPDIKKEDKDSEKSSKKLGFSSSILELKKTIGGGTVRQSFSHGRTKSVSVEVKKVRTYKAYDTSKRDATNKSDNKDMQLSDLEKEARLKAINNSIKMKEIDEKEKKEELIDKPENNNQSDITNTKKVTSKINDIKDQTINDIIPSPIKESDSDKSIRLRKEEEAEERKKNTKKQLSLGRDFGRRRQ